MACFLADRDFFFFTDLFPRHFNTVGGFFSISFFDSTVAPLTDETLIAISA
jgi:hypothetical protein